MRVLHFYIVILFANVSHISTAMNFFRRLQTTPNDNITVASDSKAEEATANTLNDIPVHTLSHLSVPDIVSLSTVNKSMHQLVSEKYTKLRAERVARGIITEVAREFGRYTSEEEIKESIKKPEEEPLLKWLYRVRRIHGMCFQISNHFKATRNSLTRKENESGDDWLNRIESMLLEREALTVLYDNTNGINWRRKRNWKTDADICDWYGVDCTNGSVTTLHLYGNQLSGEIPKEIGQLTNLIVLRLYNNQLSGEIPKEICQLTNLKVLSLGKNELTGSIPTEIGQLTKLEILRLYNNQLSGSIPTEIGQLTKLKYLHLADNKLSGLIPTEIGQLTNLDKLDVRLNQLSGPIPKEIGQLTNLAELWLQNNQLTGPIPKEIFQLIQTHNLHANAFVHDNPSRPFSVIRSINHVIHEHTSLVVLGAAVGLLAALAQH